MCSLFRYHLKLTHWRGVERTVVLILKSFSKIGAVVLMKRPPWIHRRYKNYSSSGDQFWTKILDFKQETFRCSYKVRKLTQLLAHSIVFIPDIPHENQHARIILYKPVNVVMAVQKESARTYEALCWEIIQNVPPTAVMSWCDC